MNSKELVVWVVLVGKADWVGAKTTVEIFATESLAQARAREFRNDGYKAEADPIRVQGWEE